MGLAFCLGWVNTRIILTLVYYLVVTPIGLMMRLLRKDLLNLKIGKKRADLLAEARGKKSSQRKLRENILGGAKNEQNRIIERILAVSTPE